MNVASRCLTQILIVASVLTAGVPAQAEDIDIFAGTTTVNTSLPNVIFVLDNTSNWSRQSQKWPGGLVQGQAEVRAIKTALAAQVGKLNVGVVEYVTGGSAADTNAGYVRHDLQPLTADSYSVLSAKLDAIFNDINGPTEKRSSSNPYGDLPWDFYNYLSGIDHSNSGTGTPASLADVEAYTSQWSEFSSPLDESAACADTHMIFIGNNTNGSIASDDTTNSNALKAAYVAAGAVAPDALAGDTGTPLAMPEFACTSLPVVVTPAYTIPAYTTPAYYESDTIVPGDSYPAQNAKNLGKSTACYSTSQAAACTTAESLPGGKCAISPTPPHAPAPTAGTCSCVAATTTSTGGCMTSGPPSGRTFHLNVVGNIAAYQEPDTVIPGTYHPEVFHPAVEVPAVTETQDTCGTTGQLNTTDGKNYNFDDWAKFLHNYGVPLTVYMENGEIYSERIKVKTYTIDVFNAQQSGVLSALWFSAANAGGGRYFQAKSEDQITAAINKSLGDILSVSSSFAAVSLPLSATNRAQVDNQVYIGMFRPAPGKKPRWYGNLKRYQVALFDDEPRLADVNLHSAINPLTGFATECSESFWTTDTANYWENLGVNPAPQGKCTDFDVTNSPWSDLPDGPFVEKGGVAQFIRKLANSSARTIYTVREGTTVEALSSEDTTALGGTTVVNYLKGDAAGVDEVKPAAGLRASIHGDVVHSRPLSIRYSPSEVRIFYGANDGTFRAVDPAYGSEEWALVVPEHFGKIKRLYDNWPLIKYTAAPDPLGSALKDYFFDGSTGQLTLYNSDDTVSQAYIYPTMRRGGRMLYALDVSDPDEAPSLLWRQGCPNTANDIGCTTGFSAIGQTWSMPVGGYAKGYVDEDNKAKLVVAFGGGFDNCLNADTASYPTECSSAKGKGVYILDATTGELLRTLATDAPVITELSSVDIDFDGNIDFAYAADVAGNLYRVNFATMNSANPEAGVTALAKDAWTIVKIGATTGGNRRFYNAPVAAAFQGSVLVTVGSGDRERPLEINYPYASDVQNRFYALFDEPYKTFVATPGELGEGKTTTINLDGDSMLAVVASEYGEAEVFSLEYDGWYLDLSDRGEQVVNPAVIGGGKVFFNTFQPGGVSNGLCSRPLGIGTGYAVNAFSPEYTQGNEIEGPGIPIPPVIATLLIPPGMPECDGADCPEAPEDPCASGECEVRTICIGCDGFEPLEIVPDAPPLRRRVFFTEDVDRVQ